MLRITLPPISNDERARGVRGRATHRTSHVEVVEVEVEGGRIEAVSATYEDRPPYKSIEVQASGSSLVFETMGEWVAWNYDWDRIWKSASPDNERNLRVLAERMLSVLMVIEEHIPAIHLPPASFEDLSEDQMRLIDSELPAAMTPALERFAPGIVKIAQEVGKARAGEQAIREAKARRARIRAQFATLPAGTMLIHRGRSDQIAVVSDERGRQSSRSLDLFTAKRGSTPRKVDMTLQNREDFVLFTPGKVRKLEAGFVSAHQIMKGLAQAKELGPAYPDLLPSPLFDFMW